MGGFKKRSNNTAFEQNLFSLIISHISQCCEKMREDCKTTGNSLYNHEDKISNRLVERYLDVNSLGLRFVLQKPEHYDAETDTHKGRTDITVVSSDWLKNHDAYYIIECKRIDGKLRLNREYVSEGISRFVMSPLPKYHSYYGRNIILGYVVQAINIGDNTRRIDSIQREILIDVAIGEMSLVYDNGNGFYRYRCLYQTSGNLNLELAHLFYDFSDAICANK
jgi:hypothetical protein